MLLPLERNLAKESERLNRLWAQILELDRTTLVRREMLIELEHNSIAAYIRLTRFLLMIK